MTWYIDWAEGIINRQKFTELPVLLQTFLTGVLALGIFVIPTLAAMVFIFGVAFAFVGFGTSYWWLSAIVIGSMTIVGIYYLGKYAVNK